MKIICKALFFVLAAFVLVSAPEEMAFAQNAPAATGSRAIGTIQSISGTTLTLKTDQGAVMTISVQPSARVLRIAPGETNLKNAAPISLTDIQDGDRVLASGDPGTDGKTVLANSVIAIKKADVASKQQQDLQDWTRRGVGGLVSAVDASAGTIALKVSVATGTRTVTVHTSGNTNILRYAPDSVKFDDAKTSTLGAIQAGDQLLARGTRSADGGDVTADAIVSGAFRNLSGTISSVNAAQNSITLTDLATKKPVTVKITADSQMKKLPTAMATALGARMKAASGGASATAGGTPDASAGAADNATGGRGFSRGGRGAGGAADLSQLIARSPAVTLTDLQKGDAVMIVSTAGTDPGVVSAITLVAGVEPILEASPTAGMNLPAWNVGGGDAGAAPTD